MKKIIITALTAAFAFSNVACSADNIKATDEADIEQRLTLNEPTIENEKIKFSVETNIDAANIIVALYNENGVLSAVKTDTIEGEFDADSGIAYSIKAFAWEKDTMKPITSRSERVNIAVSKSPLKEFLNNTMETADGTLHYTYYLPENYDDEKAYPMLITCPGWSSLFYTIETTPITENRHAKENAEVWTDIYGDMIVVSPSLTDWGDKSARQTIELTDYFTESFSVDKSRIYASGFSAGGETLSRVVDKRPEMFAAYLHCASQWDGGYDNVTKARLKVYVAMAENDSYYHSVKAYEAYNGLKAAYENEDMSESDIENLLVLDLKENSYFDASVSDYHAGGYYIMQDRDIIRWMIGK